MYLCKKERKHRKMKLTWICLPILASKPFHPQISQLTAAPSLSRGSETSKLSKICKNSLVLIVQKSYISSATVVLKR